MSKSIDEYEILIKDFPFNNYDKESVIKAIEMLSAAMERKGYDYRKISKEIILDIENNKFQF